MGVGGSGGWRRRMIGMLGLWKIRGLNRSEYSLQLFLAYCEFIYNFMNIIDSML